VVAARPLGATALPETLRAITLAALESKREALVGLIPADWRVMLDGLPAGAPRAPEGGGAAGAGGGGGDVRKAPRLAELAKEITASRHLSPTPGGETLPGGLSESEPGPLDAKPHMGMV
jgi:hypothetical protein